jgi:hypothetical protein
MTTTNHELSAIDHDQLSTVVGAQAEHAPPRPLYGQDGRMWNAYRQCAAGPLESPGMGSPYVSDAVKLGVFGERALDGSPTAHDFTGPNADHSNLALCAAAIAGPR